MAKSVSTAARTRAAVRGRRVIARVVQGGAWGTLVAACGLFALLLSARAAEEPLVMDPTRVLTNLSEIWSVPQAARGQAWRVRTEFVVYYLDGAWSCNWGECGGQPGFLPLGRSVPDFRAGQRVALDGLIVPDQQQVLWDRSRYELVGEPALPLAIPTRGRLADTPALDGRWVEVEGLVDTQVTVDAHFTLNLLAEGLSVTVRSPEGNRTNAPHLEGAYVRLKGVYSVGRGFRNSKAIILWVPDLRQAEVIGRLGDDGQFALPVTVSARFGTLSSNQLVRVEGIVKGAEPGKSVTLWDATGQVEIFTAQTGRFALGQRVEAIGLPAKENLILMLREGVVRPLAVPKTPESSPAAPTRPAKLFFAGQVRELAPEAAPDGIPVELEGMLLWHHPSTPFIFLQDASGGVRVDWSKPGNQTAPEPGAILRVRGVTAKGEFCPVITNAALEAVGFLDLPDAQFITLEQALTGVEECRWVQMGGCVREVIPEGNLFRVRIATTAGDFDALVPGADWMPTISGLVIRVRGVCTAVCDSRGRLKGIQLWVPLTSLLQVEESEPDDLFKLPLYPLGKLGQFNALNSLNRRVRTRGTVLLHAPGRYLYAQDGDDGLFVLSRETAPLVPGDQVEIVGFPGSQKGRFLLREASYRRIGTGKAPAAMPIPETALVVESLESRLVKSQGRLVEVVKREQGVSLMVQGKGGLFEALLEGAKPPPERLQINSKLALAGVYEVQRDEYGNPLSFRLRLRSGHDLQRLESAPWWTADRLLWIVLSTIAILLLAMLWGTTVSRKNALLEKAQVQIEGVNRTLESRVIERTRELASAQERLMLASREAGMAEVATSVLHNVGNVLNSVNISTTLLEEIVKTSKVSNLAKIAGLLREHQGDLSRFLGGHPKGQRVIGYLETLSEHLEREQQEVREELKGLATNVEHIKEIVAMQQTHARAAGVLEALRPTEVVEDALRMQAPSFQRHALEVVREFSDLPAITMDRHQILQILNNLLQNARWACQANASGNRRVTVRVGSDPEGRFRIEVRDNGVGIAREHLTRIFSHGFTTRKDGHGFGLHSAALAAKVMGGSLLANSEGAGQGAAFVLTLPLRPSTTMFKGSD